MIRLKYIIIITIISQLSAQYDELDLCDTSVYMLDNELENLRT